MNRRKFMAQAAIAATVPVALPARSPDPVFALVLERDVIIREFSSPDIDDAVMNALGDRLSIVEARIADIPCSTLDGIAEKLRVVLGMAAFRDQAAEFIVQSAWADLLRTAGGISHGDRS